ncbi:MAG TPA: DsbA family oxidoreductase [Actinomycetota bacterium]|nr:DsbA family oxidoreductase [Actinomycetota bacterium]
MRIDVWSDLICPWCGLGKHRLEAALVQLPDPADVEVVFHSFQLDPYAPSEPKPVRDLLRQKYGLDEKGFRTSTGRIEAMAEAEGLTPYHVGDNLSGNTGLAHQLLAMAAEHGRSEAAWDRLYRAHFGERRSIFDLESLVELGSEIGLDPAEVREALKTGRYAGEVADDASRARAIGVTGVPFYLIDGKYGVSGAQPAEILLQVFDHVRAAART